jgi:hypothetical protein
MMSTASEVRTDVSPSVLPENVDGLQPAFVLDVNQSGVVLDPAFSNARAAMETLHSSYTALADAESALDRAPDPSAAKRLRSGAESRLRSAMKTADAALATIDARAREVEEGIENTLGIPLARTSVTDSQRASDVRFSLRLTREGDRFHVVRRAIEAGDTEAVAAVLSASPLASGISQEHFKQLRMLAELKFAGSLVQKRESIGKLRTTLQRAGELTRSRFAPLLGDDGREARREASLRALEGGAQ